MSWLNDNRFKIGLVGSVIGIAYLGGRYFDYMDGQQAKSYGAEKKSLSRNTIKAKGRNSYDRFKHIMEMKVKMLSPHFKKKYAKENRLPSFTSGGTTRYWQAFVDGWREMEKAKVKDMGDVIGLGFKPENAFSVNDYWGRIDGAEAYMDWSAGRKDTSGHYSKAYFIPTEEYDVPSMRAEKKNCGCGKNPCVTYGAEKLDQLEDEELDDIFTDVALDSVFDAEAYNAEKEAKKKGYAGWINETTSYRTGGSAGAYNIFENDKYKTSVYVDTFKKMVIAESRFKKDWKDVVLDEDWRVWPQTYDKKYPEKFVKLPFSNYNWSHGDVAKKNAETFDAMSFKQWSDDEMHEPKHGGSHMQFDDWLDDEIKSHGDIPLSKWGYEEEHDEKEHQHSEFFNAEYPEYRNYKGIFIEKTAKNRAELSSDRWDMTATLYKPRKKGNWILQLRQSHPQYGDRYKTEVKNFTDGLNLYLKLSDLSKYGAETFNAVWSRSGRDYEDWEWQVGDEGNFVGGDKFRIIAIEDLSHLGKGKVFIYTSLDEEGNEDGFVHTADERRFPKKKNAETFEAETMTDRFAKRFPDHKILRDRKGMMAKFRKNQLDDRNWVGWVQLTGYGKQPCILASDLKVGDHIVYNTGASAEVVEIKPKGKATLTVSAISDHDGNTYDRDYRKTAWIPILMSWNIERRANRLKKNAKMMDAESFNAESFAAYASADLTKRIREDLKKAFPNLKFSVKKSSGSLGVDVTLMKGDIDFSDLLDDIPHHKRHWEQWNDPKPEWKGERSLNQYHLDSYNPKYTELFKKILRIIRGEDWFDHSDAQTDYFHTAYYISMAIGKWNKPYVYDPKLKKGTKPTLESLGGKGMGDAYSQIDFDAESFNAPLVNERFSPQGWSLYGRKLYYRGRQQGSIIGNSGGGFRNEPTSTYTGRQHIRWTSSALSMSEKAVFDEVSQEHEPQSFEDWMDVIYETNERLNPTSYAFGAETFEYTEEWYNPALPRIVKRVKEELDDDGAMKLDDPKMYALFEDEMFDGEPTSLDSYVYNALELEYPTLTEKQKIEISEDADMLSDVWFGIDMTDEEFRDWLNEEYDDEGNLISRADWGKSAESLNADTFEAVAVKPKGMEANTPVEKVMLNEYLMNQAAREEMRQAIVSDLTMNIGGYKGMRSKILKKQQPKMLTEEYDKRLREEFED